MTGDLFVLAVVAAALAAAARPRAGMYLLVLVGCLQDPVRKIMPGTPPWMAIAGLPVWLGMCLGAFTRDRDAWGRFERAYPALGRLSRLFILCLVPPGLVALSYGLGAWRMALLGAFAYLEPLATIVLGFSFVRRGEELRELLVFYVTVIGVLLVGTVLEYLDWGSALVGTRALGAAWIRYPEHGGDPFALLSGFFRSPDIMGWHASMAVMISLTLAVASSRTRDRAWVLLAAWAAASLLVAGRRKMMLMPVIWALFMLWANTTKGRTRMAGALLLAMATTLGGLWFLSGEGLIQGDYYSYAATTARDAPERFRGGTIQALWDTLLQSGALGRGLGSATQGAQHIEGGAGQSWQESGASKLMVELGLPGFCCSLLLVIVLLGAVRRLVDRAPLSTAEGTLVVSLTGMLVANGVCFLVSHQVYGDLLVVTTTAFVLGVVLSGPRWAKPGQQARPPARRATPWVEAQEP